jgi:hypothetical protein
MLKILSLITKERVEKNENRLFFYYYTDKQGRKIFNDGRHITKTIKEMV